VDAMHDPESGLPASILGVCRLLLDHIATLLARSGCWKKNSASGRGPTRPRAG
jgi:hypothetical protein